MSGTRNVELRQMLLGYYPYILVELKPKDGEDIGLSLEAGGFPADTAPETAEDFIEYFEDLAAMMRESLAEGDDQ